MIMHEFACKFALPVVTATYSRHIDWTNPQAQRYDVCLSCGARSETRKEAL